MTKLVLTKFGLRLLFRKNMKPCKYKIEISTNLYSFVVAWNMGRVFGTTLKCTKYTLKRLKGFEDVSVELYSEKFHYTTEKNIVCCVTLDWKFFHYLTLWMKDAQQLTLHKKIHKEK